MCEKAKTVRRWLAGRISWLPVAVGSTGWLTATEALAAASGTPAQNPVGGGLFVAWAIAYLTRKRAIGGWLLYFYIQLYMSLLISLLFIPKIISNLNPTEWDGAMRYVLFILSTVPVLLAEGLEAFAATKLLFVRNEGNLRFLRKVLSVLLATSAVSFAIDITYFSEESAMVFDLITLVFAGIWYAYFAKARRVQLVFVDKAWHYVDDSTKLPRTPEVKRHLRNRAALIGVITFIVLLILMGMAMGDKKPNWDILAMPTVWAFIAAAISLFAPIRKKKLDALLNAQPKSTDMAQ